jgi:hypothetical protein
VHRTVHCLFHVEVELATPSNKSPIQNLADGNTSGPIKKAEKDQITDGIRVNRDF